MSAYLLGPCSGPCFIDLPCERHAAIGALLRRHLSRGFEAFFEEVRQIDASQDTTPGPEELAQPISVLSLPTRYANKLLENGVDTIGDILEKGERRLRMDIPGFSKASAEEVKRALRMRNIILPP